MAVDAETKAVRAMTTAVCDIRFNPYKYGRIAVEAPANVLTAQANAYLAFFEMLSLRWDAGDFEAENANLLRLSKKIVTVWQEVIPPSN